jgi:tRNA (cmo5U34)-methyltransferase
MSHKVSRHLRIEVATYDRKIRQFVPGYETMLRIASALTAEIKPGHVLDLGSGSGGLSEALLSYSEIGIVELWDIDPEMLEHAQIRLFDYGERARFELRSFNDPFPACDAITACISLHHVPSLEKKQALYQRAYNALRSGGVFVNADAAVPTHGKEKERLYRYWARHLVASGIPEGRAWQHFEEWAEEDSYFSLTEELAALSAVGFDAHCVWREGPSAVLLGRRL